MITVDVKETKFHKSIIEEEGTEAFLTTITWQTKLPSVACSKLASDNNDVCLGCAEFGLAGDGVSKWDLRFASPLSGDVENHKPTFGSYGLVYSPLVSQSKNMFG